ncbi:unnamed protein product [Closterium sp. Naga37s-1]|nr:unnamed protein product [Closterium sp. Naga37s-1]
MASTCRACLPPMFSAAADGSPPNPNWEIDFDWLSDENQIAMARFAVAQHNAAKSLPSLHSSTLPLFFSPSPLPPSPLLSFYFPLFPFSPTPLLFSPPSLLPVSPSPRLSPLHARTTAYSQSVFSMWSAQTLPAQAMAAQAMAAQAMAAQAMAAQAMAAQAMAAQAMAAQAMAAQAMAAQAMAAQAMAAQAMAAQAMAAQAMAAQAMAAQAMAAQAMAAQAMAAQAMAAQAMAAQAMAAQAMAAQAMAAQAMAAQATQARAGRSTFTREEQEAALRHVVPVTPPPCGDLLTFVDSSDVDVQRVAREAVASANKRQGSALLLISVVEAQVLVPSYRYREYNFTLLAADEGTGMAAHYATHALDNSSGATPDTSQGGNASGRGLVNVTAFAVVPGTQRNATAGEMGVAAAGGCAGRNASSSSAGWIDNSVTVTTAAVHAAPAAMAPAALLTAHGTQAKAAGEGAVEEEASGGGEGGGVAAGALHSSPPG